MENKKFACDLCDSTFSRKDNLTKHVKTMHAGGADFVHSCGMCGEAFSDYRLLKEHRRNHVATSNLEDFILINSAHGKSNKIYRLLFPSNVGFVMDSFIYLKDRLLSFMSHYRLFNKIFKFGLVLTVEFVKIGEDGHIETQINVPFRSRLHRILPFQNIEDDVTEMFHEINNNIETFTQSGSGWSINDILHSEIETYKIKPLSG